MKPKRNGKREAINLKIQITKLKASGLFNTEIAKMLQLGRFGRQIVHYYLNVKK